MSTSPRTAVFLTIIATFFWGSNFVVVKSSLASLPPWTAAAERFVIAAICISLVLHFKTGFNLKVLRQNALAYALLGGVGIAGFNGAFFIGLQTADPVTAALIMATTPLSANFFEAALNRRFPGQWRIAGMIISLIGVALVVTDGTFFMGVNLAYVPGDGIIVLGSLVWALYTVGCRRFVKESTPLETTTWTMISGALTLVVMAFIVEQPLTAVAGGTFYSHAATVYLATMGAVLAYLFFITGVYVRGPGRTAVFLNFVPVFALLISIVQGHVPREIQVLGIIVTILGVMIADGTLVATLAKTRRFSST